jgi:GntR family transcriptional regulator
VIPFRLTFDPGMSLYEQVVYAAKKAIISGKLKGGDPFPSVRALSAGLKINQNTAHKVIGHLVSQGVLEVRSGIGTVVAGRLGTSAVERSNLLKKELEQLAVEAKKLGLGLEQVTAALAQHWRRLDGEDDERDTPDNQAVEAVWQGVSAGPSEPNSVRGQRVRTPRAKWRG